MKSIINCLKIILGLKHVDYMELETVLKENCVLFGRRLQITNDQVLINDIPKETTISSSKSYKYLMSVLQSFWKM